MKNTKQSAQQLINQLFRTKFKFKKSAPDYGEFENKTIYICEIGEDGEIAIGLSPFEPDSCWYNAEDLVKV